MSEYKIVRNGEKFDVFINGVFICSEDTFMKAVEQVEIAYEGKLDELFE